MVVHVVLFKLKDRSPGAIARAAEVLGGLEGKVPVIRKIDVGVDVLRSGRSYDIALSVRLDSLSDLEAYQAHPEHVKVAEYIASVRESVAVVDYEE
ncbi:Dabb family protein [bacterium]|nr:Dabb family protein [bacterium]